MDKYLFDEVSLEEWMANELELMEHPHAFPNFREWAYALYSNYKKLKPYGTTRSFIAMLESGEFDPLLEGIDADREASAF